MKSQRHMEVNANGSGLMQKNKHRNRYPDLSSAIRPTLRDPNVLNQKLILKSQIQNIF